jgi:fatty acid desaturase
METGADPPAGTHPALARGDLRRLTARNNSKALAHSAIHLGLLAAGAALVLAARGTPWIFPALLGQGIVLTFLFAPLHECIHRTAFRSRAANAAVAVFCGAVLLLPAQYFRAFHFQHHRFTQDPERDPELAAPAPAGRAGYLLRLTGLPYWCERLSTLWRHARGKITEPFIAAHQRPAVRREARLHLGLYALLAAASLAAGSTVLLWLWVLPALLGQPFLRAFLMAEHSGCPQVPAMLANSRTTLTNPVMETLCWHMNRHSAHHAFPAIPFHALPAADALLAARIGPRAAGYRAVHRQIWARLASA